MLIISRNTGESLVINENVTVTVLTVNVLDTMFNKVKAKVDEHLKNSKEVDETFWEDCFASIKDETVDHVKVKLGINAPKDIVVDRLEVHMQKQARKAG